MGYKLCMVISRNDSIDPTIVSTIYIEYTKKRFAADYIKPNLWFNSIYDVKQVCRIYVMTTN